MAHLALRTAALAVAEYETPLEFPLLAWECFSCSILLLNSPSVPAIQKGLHIVKQANGLIAAIFYISKMLR